MRQPTSLKNQGWGKRSLSHGRVVSVDGGWDLPETKNPELHAIEKGKARQLKGSADVYSVYRSFVVSKRWGWHFGSGDEPMPGVVQHLILIASVTSTLSKLETIRY